MEIKENISLRKFNTFAIDVQAKYFASFNSIEKLQGILLLPNFQHESKLILGGGSNMLFTKNLNALVLKNEISGIEIVEEDDQYVFLKAGAGIAWHELVMYCIRHQFAGVENLALIPGSVGASPMQNIGAYGVEVKEVFHSLEAIHINSKEKVVFTKSDCEFGYRESVFKHALRNQFVISSVTYRLLKKPKYNISYGAIGKELEAMGVQELSIASIAQAVMNIRNSKLPNPELMGNAGSFFKNPELPKTQFDVLKIEFPGIVGYMNETEKVKVAAGWLIEQCGWKGYRKGDAGCHDKQALVLVNFGHATGTEIYNLSEEIISTVTAKFGILLEREVNIF